MTSLIPHMPLVVDPFDWLDRLSTEHAIRIEETVEGGAYRVRAELAGFDPESDIHVTAQGGVLTISAERQTAKKSEGISEFRYGSFTRSRTLPEGSDTDKIDATYDNGILEVTVPYTEPQKEKEPEVQIKVAKA